jgi:lactate dehydrogenase-like 2-hydroxyacid dehydrogenase
MQSVPCILARTQHFIHKMTKPVVLHIGDPIKYNHEFYNREFVHRFEVVTNDALTRPDFIDALKNKKYVHASLLLPGTSLITSLRRYGDFSAIFRPHFQTGGEMGRWDDELIDLLPSSVRIFASAGAGFDWADVDTLGRRGIFYTNGAGASDEAVSDTALYMVLSVFRNFTKSQLAARTRDPEVFTATHKLIATISRNPRDHILGIVGLGNISKKLAYKAKTALGMDIHYFDVVRASSEEEEKIGAQFHETLESLLCVADCVSLHTPLNKHTHHLINSKTIAMMKPGAKIVNTARGKIVEEDALIEGLESGQISAAALDVHYHEPQVSKRLAEMDNVTLTTHIAGGALDTRINFELGAMKNVLAVVGNEGEVVGEPLTPVNLNSYRH